MPNQEGCQNRICVQSTDIVTELPTRCIALTQPCATLLHRSEDFLRGAWLNRHTLHSLFVVPHFYVDSTICFKELG